MNRWLLIGLCALLIVLIWLKQCPQDPKRRMRPTGPGIAVERERLI